MSFFRKKFNSLKLRLRTSRRGAGRVKVVGIPDGGLHQKLRKKRGFPGEKMEKFHNGHDPNPGMSTSKISSTRRGDTNFL